MLAMYLIFLTARNSYPGVLEGSILGKKWSSSQKKGKNAVLLTPKVFNKMLHLPTTNKPLKFAEEDMFLVSQENGANILR